MRGSLPVGFMLNRYRVESVLSDAGNFGIVYLACDMDHARAKNRADAVAGRLGRWKHPTRFGPIDATIDPGPIVALKEYAPFDYVERRGTAVIPRARREDVFSWGRDRFVQESEFMAGLSHPNIVALFDLFQANNTAYYVMERLPGGSLADRFRQHGRQREGEVRQWLMPLLRGLESVEHAGGDHLDLSPDNIMFRRSVDEPVLVDFGAARIPDAKQPPGGSRLLVNDSYAAPEKYLRSSRDLTAAADIYSVGAIVQEALIGYPPRAAPDLGSALAAYDPTVARHASPELNRALQRALLRDPHARFANAHDFFAAIDVDSSISTSHAIVPYNPNGGDQTNKILALLIIAAILLLVIILALVIS